MHCVIQNTGKTLVQKNRYGKFLNIKGIVHPKITIISSADTKDVLKNIG